MVPHPSAGRTGPVGRIRSVFSDVRAVLGSGPGDPGPYRSGDHGPLVSADDIEGREIDRYWLRPPYSFAVITYESRRDEHHYHVVEPGLDSREAELLDRAMTDVRSPLLYRSSVDEDAESALRAELFDRLDEYGVDIDPASAFRIYYYLHRDFLGYGKIDPLLADPNVEDISADGAGVPIYVYHDDYDDVATNVVYDADGLQTVVVRLAQRSGRHVSVSDPVVSTTLPDGSRIELAYGTEVTPRGSAFTIRKYADDPFTPIDLLDSGTVDLEMLAFLWLAIEHNKSILIAGGTAAGKTTTMNALSMFVPPGSKVLTIEDTRELSLYHENWLSAVTRDRIADEETVTMYDLLRSALRHRPEYIIVGEVRGEEAITLFQAMNTGHTTFSTIHADSVQMTINRLENEPINVPRAMVASLDLLCVQVLTRRDDERVRRIRTLAEIEGIDRRTGDIDYTESFQYDGSTDSFERTITGLIDEIVDERGWSRSRVLDELRQRSRYLDALQRRGVDDYRRFTARINEYYADREAALQSLTALGERDR
ncbi:MAG: type II/IV secretion system ATPase subunit [Halococcoides sp.]